MTVEEKQRTANTAFASGRLMCKLGALCPSLILVLKITALPILEILLAISILNSLTKNYISPNKKLYELLAGIRQPILFFCNS